MIDYTVFGYYSDSDQRFCSHYQAASANDAEKLALQSASPTLYVVACIAGIHNDLSDRQFVIDRESIEALSSR